MSYIYSSTILINLPEPNENDNHMNKVHLRPIPLQRVQATEMATHWSTVINIDAHSDDRFAGSRMEHI